MDWSTEIDKLCALMKRHDLLKVRIKDQHLEVELERASEVRSTAIAPGPAMEVSSCRNYVLSPMVGTLYLRPAPGKAPFVQRGDLISADTVVAIVEAMKIMNDVTAGKEGRILRILLEDGQPVEYGTPIFELESSDGCA